MGALHPVHWPIGWAVAVFVVSGAVIGMTGTHAARTAELLARRTGLGQAMFGAIFLGGVTSLPGIVTSVVAAWQGHPELAVSNAIGGIAAQTVFLVIADLTYRRANLEHAAASLTNLAHGTLVVALLAMPLVAMSGPEITVLAVHPVSIMLIAGYLFGLRVASRARDAPMWSPRLTSDTRDEDADTDDDGSVGLATLWVRFAVLAVLLAGSGYAIAQTAIAIAEHTGLSESAVGVYLTAIPTSLPELVTCLAAVRRGALALAVGDILGGNAFDVLFIALADVAWRGGSIYHAVTASQSFFIALTILLTGVLLLGMISRQRHGVANIGFESALVLGLYLLGSVVIFW